MSEELKIHYRCDTGMAVLAAIIFLVICIMSTGDIFASLYYYDDMVAYNSGANFAEHGFFKLHFLPVHPLGPVGDIPRYYLHYPPLPNIINGLMQTLGIKDLMKMRIICGLFLITGLVCLYKSFAGVIGPFASLCGTAFFVTTQYFIRLSLSIHHHSYDILLLGIFFLIFLRTIESEKPHKIRWFTCWLVLFLGSLSSFEFIIYSQLFAIVYVIFSSSLRRRWPVLMILATAPLTGVSLHFLQNFWAIGFSAALADNLGFNFWDGNLGPGRWHYTWEVPQRIVERSLYYFNISLISLLILSALIPILSEQKFLKSPRRFYAVLWGTIIASASWYLFMPGHTLRHPHTMNQLLPMAIIVLGCVIAAMLIVLFKKESNHWHKKLIIFSLLILLCSQAQSFVRNHMRGYHRTAANTIMQAIGPNAFKQDAAFFCNLEPGASVIFEFLLKRPCWTVTEEPVMNEKQPDPNNPRFKQNFPWDECPQEYLLYCLNNDYTIKQLHQYLTGVSADECPLRYFMYFGKDNYTDKPLFQALAAECPGRVKKIAAEKFGTENFVILFDISRLQLPKEQRPLLDRQIKQQQLEGIFPEWEIQGFEQRLDDKIKKYKITRTHETTATRAKYGIKRP